MAKIMYVAHEVSGDVEGNVRKILDICRRAHTNDVIPFAPYLSVLQYLDDSYPEDRALGLEANAEYFRRGLIDEVGVFGSRVTTGIFGELELALQLGIPVKACDPRVKVDVRYALTGLRGGKTLFKHLAAERRLANGNPLFFKRDAHSGDIVLCESDVFIDPETGKDVSQFVPTVVSWEEILDGWSFLDARCSQLPRDEVVRFRSRTYDGLARLYEERQPLGMFCTRSSFDEIAK